MRHDRPRGETFVPPWIDKDDLEQEISLARIEAEATGFDPDVAGDKARGNHISRERTRLCRETAASSVFHETDTAFTDVNSSLGWLAESKKVVALSPPKRQTDGQRKRFLRNQLIFAGSLAGFSHRKLATIFDMPNSRIFAIVDEMSGRTGLAKKPG